MTATKVDRVGREGCAEIEYGRNNLSKNNDPPCVSVVVGRQGRYYYYHHRTVAPYYLLLWPWLARALPLCPGPIMLVIISPPPYCDCAGSFFLLPSRFSKNPILSSGHNSRGCAVSEDLPNLLEI